MEDYQQLVKSTILDEATVIKATFTKATFIKATFSGAQGSQVMPWKRVVVRPVLLKNEKHLQFSYFDSKRDITKNYIGGEAATRLDELLAMPFKSIYVQTSDGAIQVQVKDNELHRKGKAVITRHKTQKPLTLTSLQHDRPKQLLLPADRPDPFLQQIGMMTCDGKVRADQQKKFRQINEFLKLVIETMTQTEEWAQIDRPPMRIVDCGCGSAHLTLAVYHYLNHILGRPAHLTGVDINAELIHKLSEQIRDWGWDRLSFEVSQIAEYQPAAPPDIVLSLHACDTATDEALAQAVKWGSRMILSVPCCHHHLQRQFGAQSAPPLRPLLRYGTLKERMGDLLTDTFRSLILNISGYRTDVIEFISTEHTAKNIMIRAVRTVSSGHEHAWQEYNDLKAFWQVTPYLEQLLDIKKPLQNSA